MNAATGTAPPLIAADHIIVEYTPMLGIDADTAVNGAYGNNVPCPVTPWVEYYVRGNGAVWPMNTDWSPADTNSIGGDPCFVK